MIVKWRWIAPWIAVAALAAAEEEPPKPVTVVTATPAPVVTRLDLTGSVTARRQAQLSSRASGLIRKLHVDAGDVVEKGDVLMELDDELAALALERVAADRELARLELADARRLEEEGRNLAKSGAFPRSEADSRETALKLATTALSRGEVLEKEQQAVLQRHRLIAPFGGVISGKLAEEGEWVQTGTPVVELVETDALRMDVQAPQEAYPLLQKDPTVEVRLDAYPEQPLTGKIAVIVPVKDAVARTFLARIALDDPQKLAAPGMSGRVIFNLESEKPVLQIPRDAVVRFPDGTAKVWAIAGDKAVSRTVVTGETLTGSIEILSGIEPGERVVLRGNEALREGQSLEILPATR